MKIHILQTLILEYCCVVVVFSQCIIQTLTCCGA